MAGAFDDLIPAGGAQPGGAPAYPTTGDPSYTPNDAQSRAAWSLYHSGKIDQKAPRGSQAYPAMAAPGHPVEPGSYMIDLGGNLRIAGKADDGTPPPDDFGQFGDLVPKPDPVIDSLKTIPGHLAQGVTGMLGLPRALAQGQEWLNDKAADVTRQVTGQAPLTPEQREHLHNLTRMMQRSAPTMGLVNPDAPSTAGMDRAIQQVAGHYYEPKTTAGRYVGAVAQFAPNAALGGGGLAARAALAVFPALASQGGADLVDKLGHPEWEPYARFGGALAGGLPVAARSLPSASQRLMTDATAGMTDADLAATQGIRVTGQDLGVPVTVAEAAQKATGNAAPDLARMQQRVEATPQGAGVFGPLMAARPHAMADAVRAYVAKVAPATDQPSMIGVNAQAAAKGAIGALEEGRAAATAPSYAAAGPVTVDPDDMGGLMRSLDAQIGADKTGVLAKPLGQVREMLTDNAATEAARAAQRAPQSVRDSVEQAWAEATGQPVGKAAPLPGRIPILDIENLDRARKYIRDTTGTKIGNGILTPEQGAKLHAVADSMDGMMERASQDFVAGKAMHADLSQGVVTPAQAGPLGTIAASRDVPTQTGALYPSRPLGGAAAETADAIDALGRQTPDIAAALTRQHLERGALDYLGEDAKGPDLYGGAKWAASVGGGLGQRQALDAGLGAISPELATQYADLHDVLSATGRRLPVTPHDSAHLADALTVRTGHPLELGVTAGVGSEAFGHGGGILLPVAAKAYGAASGALNKWRVATNARALAEALTVAPEDTISSIAKARQRGKIAPFVQAQILADALEGGRQPQR